MSAFKATYSDWKLIKTRGVVQVVMEVPLADADAAYTVLGGMPNSAKEQWFGIAPIKPAKEVMPNPPQHSEPVDARPEPKQNPAARAKLVDITQRHWRDMLPAQQAGIRCNEPEFMAFLREERAADWIEVKTAEDSMSLHETRGDTTPFLAVECVRLICGVESRKELNTDHRARVIWHQLDEQFQTWKALERAS